MSQEEKYQKAQDALVKATEEFKAQNCAGLSAEACGAKMEAHRDELLKGFADAGLDFVPVVGTIKTLAGAAVGGAVDGSAGVGSGASAGRTEAENNSLSDIAEQLASGESPADKLDKLN